MRTKLSVRKSSHSYLEHKHTHKHQVLQDQLRDANAEISTFNESQQIDLENKEIKKQMIETKERAMEEVQAVRVERASYNDLWRKVRQSQSS